MLQAPNPTAYDLQFNFLGFPVRVSWSFWLMCAVLGWNWCEGLQMVAEQLNVDSPGAPALLIVWTGCVFVSILIHELGHALAMRHFGQSAHIVLYHFGGLAINDAFSRWDGARRYRTVARDDLIISAAGPAAQLLLAVVAALIGWQLGIVPYFLSAWFNVPSVPITAIGSIAVYAMVEFLVWTSIFWAILNLAPILPLDGGQVMYNILLILRIEGAWLKSRVVSVVTGVAIGLFFMWTAGGMNGIMFLLLAASNWQEIQQGGRGF